MEKSILLKKLDAIDKPFLEGIYLESEFIDPVNEIYDKIHFASEKNVSTPFVITQCR